MRLRATHVAAALGLLALAAPGGAVPGGDDDPEPAAEGAGEPERAPRILLDKSPRVVAFQLGRLTNRQLAQVERRTDYPKYRPVYEALLARKGLDRKYREEAIAALAALNRSDAAAELLAAVERIDAAEEDDGGVLHDLVHLLLAQERAALAAGRKRLEALASGGRRDLTRQIGFAALVRADGELEGAWRLAAGDGQGLLDLLRSVPMHHDPGRRSAVFLARVLPLAREPREAVRRAAIEALGYLQGEGAQTFAFLAELFREKLEREAVARSLWRLPRSAWPAQGLEELAQAVVAFIEETPPQGRTGPGLLEAMELGRELAARLPQPRGAEVRRALASLSVPVILIKTVPHQMLFDRRFFVVEAGKPVELVLENPDIMAHNLVIVAPGALEEVGAAAELMQPDADPRAKDFVPASAKVLEATRLLPPQSRETLRFTAPAEPGDYPYVCTFPGHWRRMYGVMVVARDPEAWLAEGKEPPDPLGSARKFVREWKLEDFQESLAAPPRGAGPETGKKLFTEASCLACHKLPGQGGGVGPELAGVLGRLKGSRAELLRQVLDPASAVEEKYRSHLVRTRDGRTLVGIIIAQDAESVSLVWNPLDPAPERLPLSRIALRAAAEGSLMPVGLLNHFTREEVIEILAFLESGGDPRSPVYLGGHAGH